MQKFFKVRFLKYLPCSYDFTLYLWRLDRLIKLILNVGMGTYFVWLNNFQFTQKAKMCTSWWGIFPVLVHYDAQSCVLRKLGPMASDDCKVHSAQICKHSSIKLVTHKGVSDLKIRLHHTRSQGKLKNSSDG